MDILEFIKKMQEMYGEDVITTANKINRPDPKPIVKEIEIFNEFNRRNPKADGGQLVAPSVDGSRPGYADKRGIKTVHLINETGNPNHSGIYKTTNTNTGSVSYRGGYTRDGRKTTKSSSTIKGARELLDKALKIPKGKNVIPLQAEKAQVIY